MTYCNRFLFFFLQESISYKSLKWKCMILIDLLARPWKTTLNSIKDHRFLTCLVSYSLIRLKIFLHNLCVLYKACSVMVIIAGRIATQVQILDKAVCILFFRSPNWLKRILMIVKKITSSHYCVFANKNNIFTLFISANKSNVFIPLFTHTFFSCMWHFILGWYNHFQEICICSFIKFS